MNRMSEKEKSIIREYMDAQPPLPFPARQVETCDGGAVFMYEIPESEIGAVLEQLYFLEPVPGMDDMILDVHENKRFRFREARVVREDGYNFIVSPFYPVSGGTILDFAGEDDLVDEGKVLVMRGVRGKKDTLMTDNLTSREIQHSNLPFGNDRR